LSLAIFNNHPTFPEPLHVGYPLVEPGLKEHFHEELESMFGRNWFTNDGPLVRRLEEEIGKRHGVEHCIAVNNATLGLLLVLRAMELKGEVILPAFTFVATAHAVWWQGLRPVFCDIEPSGLMIDPAKISQLVSPNTTALIGVHLFGNVCDVNELERIAADKKLRLVFDSAHAFECGFNESMIGEFGDAEVLSFHATKFFSTGEGGAILTNNNQLATRLRLLRNFGFKNYDEVGFLGLNAKMAETAAALGIASFPYLEDRRTRLAKIRDLYIQYLGDIPGVSIVPSGLDGKSNFHYFVILIDDKLFRINRNILYQVLWKENIQARRYFYPGCHHMEPYASCQDIARNALPVTDRICGQVLCLPTNLSQPEGMVRAIAGVISEAHERGEEIKAWIAAHPQE